MTFAAQEPRAALCRGTVVTVASPGAYSGKPRPAVVVQADRWLQAPSQCQPLPPHQHPDGGSPGADRGCLHRTPPLIRDKILGQAVMS